MATPTSDDEWKEMLYSSLECEICNLPYDNTETHTPRLLSCGHTFCQSCLGGWATTASHGHSGTNIITCPSCRRETLVGRDGLPKNFEVLRIRDELEQWTSERLAAFRAQSDGIIREKETIAREAEQAAQIAQQKADQAADHARALQQQVTLNARERQAALEAAEAAQRGARDAISLAEKLQNETDDLKRQLQLDALQLQQIKKDASTSSAIAADLESKANALQAQVDRVKSQLLLHSGKQDPTRMVVLVCDPITVGSWLLPYTRYTVICIANENGAMDSMLAARDWIYSVNLTQANASVRVYRRYSDFGWLHDALCVEYPGLFVPFLPGKTFFNGHADFVNERMRSLQAFLREILRNPVLSRGDDVRAFLLFSTEELEKYKLAKAPVALASDVVVAAPPKPKKVHSSSWLRTGASTGQWAWGAVSSLTSSAAKLVTTTAGLGDDDALLEVDSEHAWLQLRRKSYEQLCHMYEKAVEKGEISLRGQRKQATELSELGHLLGRMVKLDDGIVKRSQSLYTFQARVEGELRGMGADFGGVADMSEHAVQETLRMQVLQLGAIEEAFGRVKVKQEAVEGLESALHGPDVSLRDDALSKLPTAKTTLDALKASVVGQLKELEPTRSIFVARSLAKCCEDLRTLSTESRVAWETLRARLDGAE
ncbi:hypothetical protein SDRG_01847 [Saprolegnia diclina VS20]|uniref:RING-type domain-containing protein n=1 Tax=Saprolegnia diclina (strain VS20) TaxID=1156394 RepID=T0R1D7_SAPDV|nr:hypothetical protein SDRG_01847 [Saprolegnia diclina VS20]EQC40776.1 hypothetical protein SDRG_01847 [Saprolegnia diclina VS20]|eukprot:XP_008605620.1 hypothetical protein SDRG_01847 [Saprolegnia diclina VS20]